MPSRRWLREYFCVLNGEFCFVLLQALPAASGGAASVAKKMGRRSSDTEEESRSRRKKKHRRRSSSSSSSDSRSYSRKKSGRKSRSRSRSRDLQSWSHSYEKRRRHRSSSSSSYGSRRKRSRSRGRGKSYRSQRSRSKSRARRDSANIKAGLEHLTPAEQAKARLQLVLEAAACNYEMDVTALTSKAQFVYSAAINHISFFNFTPGRCTKDNWGLYIIVTWAPKFSKAYQRSVTLLNLNIHHRGLDLRLKLQVVHKEQKRFNILVSLTIQILVMPGIYEIISHLLPQQLEELRSSRFIAVVMFCLNRIEINSSHGEWSCCGALCRLHPKLGKELMEYLNIL
ncbi:hypothetical protein IHE44_0002133 [Lamprotornis superbus]|uniref:Uncharacterized protein n=1 Tax=Lamprotornis superbus TaxID=245042 RepID=A0A835NIL9_9PASS|nr:hypothetical protein IHE44_0002133 [Lamprotornis superbus]